VKFEFIAGRLALDFVATISERTTTRHERLTSPADLADWIAMTGVIDEPVPVTAAGLARAKELREALFGLVTAITSDQVGTAADRDLVNAMAVAAPPVPHLLDGLRARRDGDLRSFLSLVARDAIDMFTGPDRNLVRWCADETCTRPFLDRSRGHRRHWCGMSGCGDRAKAAAYRRRQREAPVRVR
jgi:predicted RNA-binding Zn ribbon-like protein